MEKIDSFDTAFLSLIESDPTEELLTFVQMPRFKPFLTRVTVSQDSLRISSV